MKNQIYDYSNTEARFTFLESEYNQKYVSNLLENRNTLLDIKYFADLEAWLEKANTESEKEKRNNLYYYIIDRLDIINDKIKAKNPEYIKSMIELFMSKEIKSFSNNKDREDLQDKCFIATSEVFKLIQDKIKELKGI